MPSETHEEKEDITLQDQSIRSSLQNSLSNKTPVVIDMLKNVRGKSYSENEIDNPFESKLLGAKQVKHSQEKFKNKILTGGTIFPPSEMSNDEVKFDYPENVNIDKLHEQLMDVLNNLANKYQQNRNNTQKLD